MPVTAVAAGAKLVLPKIMAMFGKKAAGQAAGKAAGQGGGKAAGKAAGQGGGKINEALNKPKQLTGAAAFTTLGLIQSARANKMLRKADNAAPSLYDAQQQAYLSEINQKRRSIQSGSAYAGQIGQIRQNMAGTQQAVLQSSGGDSTGTLSGLLASQAVANRGNNEVFAQEGQQQLQYDTLGSALTNKMADRAMQLQLAKSLQLRTQGMQKKQDAFANTMGGLARLAPVDTGVDTGSPLQITAPGLAPVDTGLLSPEANLDIAMRTPFVRGGNFANSPIFDNSFVAKKTQGRQFVGVPQASGNLGFDITGANKQLFPQLFPGSNLIKK
jgi:hypothetical protein